MQAPDVIEWTFSYLWKALDRGQEARCKSSRTLSLMFSNQIHIHLQPSRGIVNFKSNSCFVTQQAAYTPQTMTSLWSQRKIYIYLNWMHFQSFLRNVSSQEDLSFRWSIYYIQKPGVFLLQPVIHHGTRWLSGHLRVAGDYTNHPNNHCDIWYFPTYQ